MRVSNPICQLTLSSKGGTMSMNQSKCSIGCCLGWSDQRKGIQFTSRIHPSHDTLDEFVIARRTARFIERKMPYPYLKAAQCCRTIMHGFIFITFPPTRNILALNACLIWKHYTAPSLIYSINHTYPPVWPSVGGRGQDGRSGGGVIGSVIAGYSARTSTYICIYTV